MNAKDTTTIGVIGLWLLCVLASLGISIGIIIAIFHFVRKFW